MANAYCSPIYVKADAERSYVTMAGFSISGGVEGNFYIKNTQKSHQTLLLGYRLKYIFYLIYYTTHLFLHLTNRMQVL